METADCIYRLYYQLFAYAMLLFKRFCSNFQRINTIAGTKKCGDKLGVQGFIQNARRLKNKIFLDVCDGSTGKKFQIVVPKSSIEIKDLTVGSSIRAVGAVQIAPNGDFELHTERVSVIVDGNYKSGYPFTSKQAQSPEYVREHLHLRTRVDYIAAVMRLRHRAQKCIHDYMDAAGFVHVNAPILSTNDCEGAGEVFTVRPDSEQLLKEMSRPHDPLPLDECYFDAKVFLTVSSQLHLEAMCYGLGNTYTLAPAFRAENCRSPLHLAEFYMLEAELAFMEDLDKLTAFIEHMIRSITNNVLTANANDLNLLLQHNTVEKKNDWNWLQSDKWPTLSYDEAAKILMQHKSQFKTPIKVGEGFSKEQELFLVQHCKAPVFVVDWPAKQKPFYMKVKRDNPNYVHALDLLMPTVGELCGGSLREIDEQRLREHEQLPAGLEWYLDLRKYGGMPTGGFGMGFERYLQLLSGVKNIRDVIPFPRYPHTCKM